MAAIHFVLHLAAEGWQSGGQAFIAKLRGDKVKQGKSRPKLGSQERDLIKQIQAAAAFKGVEPRLEPAAIHQAAHSYFLVTEEEFQAGVVGIVGQAPRRIGGAAGRSGSGRRGGSKGSTPRHL